MKTMKNKLFLVSLMVIALVCIMAVSVFAAEPDESAKTVTLKDGAELPIWDTEGDALIWYKSTANANDGYANYDYIKAQASEVSYETSWRGGINGAMAYQVATVKINIGGATYDKDDIVVFNINDKDVLVTGTNDKGMPVNCLSDTFKNSTSIEYAFLRTDTVALQANAFIGASNLMYVNFEELTELNQIVGQCFNGCTSLFDGKTMDLSNTKITTMNSGSFNNTPIGAIIFPKTLTGFASWSMQGLTKIKRIDIPETVTWFSDTMFKNCYKLETVTGFAALFERGVLSAIPGATFQDCNSLVSVDLPETYTSIGGWAFYGTSSLKGTFTMPHECTSIGDNAFQGTGYETMILSPAITSIPAYAFRASYIKYLYMPAGVTSIANEVFRDMKVKMVIYYTGTNPETLKNVTVNNYNGVILDKSTVYVSASEFDLENKEDKNYVVFGYDHCAAFFGGHAWKGDESVSSTVNYFAPIEIVDTCANCLGKSIVKTIAPIFTWKGYAYSTYGEAYSVEQCFYVNNSAILEYTVYAPEFDYGVIATGNAGGTEIAPKLGEEKVQIGKFEKGANNYIVMKVIGITSEYASKNIVFCAYVLDGGKMFYLDGGVTSETVLGVSYNYLAGKTQG